MKHTAAVIIFFTVPFFIAAAPAPAEEAARGLEAADTDLGYGSAHWTVNQKRSVVAALDNADTDRNGDDKYWVKHKERSTASAEADQAFDFSWSDGQWKKVSDYRRSE